jgi:hypothetical protein
LNESLASAVALKASAETNLRLAQQRREKASEELDLFVASQSSLAESQERELSQFRAELSLSGGGAPEDAESVRRALQAATGERTAAEQRQQQAASTLRAARAKLESANKKISEASLERKNLDSNVRYRAARREWEEKQVFFF